jgi:hypothetical protein
MFEDRKYAHLLFAKLICGLPTYEAMCYRPAQAVQEDACALGEELFNIVL